MSTLFSNFTTLNCIYFAMVIAGLIYAVGLLLLGEFGGGDGDAGDVGADGADGGVDFGDADLQIFSPITAATFVTVFGATGLVCTIGLDMDPRLSLVVAAVAGGTLSLIVAYIYGRVLVEMHGTTEISHEDMIGVIAQVTIPIPANGLGEVRLEVKRELISRPARSSDNTDIARGTTVVVEDIVPGAVIVRPK